MSHLLQQEDAGAVNDAALAARLLDPPPPPAQGCRRFPGLVKGTTWQWLHPPKNQHACSQRSGLLKRYPVPHTPTPTKVPAASGGVRHAIAPARPVVGPLYPRSSRIAPKRVRRLSLSSGLGWCNCSIPIVSSTSHLPETFPLHPTDPPPVLGRIGGGPAA